MKAKVTGRSAWQGTPISGSLDVQVAARYVDSEGNASVSRYTGVLNAGKTGWANSLNTAEDLWLVVQGPDDPKGVRATFRETLVYADRTVTTEFSRVLRSSDLTGLIFDYAEPIFEAEDLDFGDAPLTMRAAQQVIEEGGAVVSEWSDIKVDIAQSAALATAAAGIVPRDNLAAITGADGYYRAMDTGYVWQRETVGSITTNTRRVDLESLSGAGLRSRGFVSITDPEFGLTGNVIDGALAAALAVSKHVLIPEGTWRLNSTANLANLSGALIRGAGRTRTTIVLNTGGTAFDLTGARGVVLRDLTGTTATATTPSTLGVLYARSTVNNFAEFNGLKNVSLGLDTAPAANGGAGSVALYNYTAELMHLDSVYLMADRPAVIALQNIYGVTSAFATMQAVSSMSVVDIGNGSSLRVVGGGIGPALTVQGVTQLRMSSAYLSRSPGGTYPYAIQVIGSLSHSVINGNVEDFEGVLTTDGQIEACEFDARTYTHAGTPSFFIDKSTTNNAKIINCRLRVIPKSGSTGTLLVGDSDTAPSGRGTTFTGNRVTTSLPAPLAGLRGTNKGNSVTFYDANGPREWLGDGVPVFHSTHMVQGSESHAQLYRNASYTLTDTDHAILGDSTTASITLTLPALGGASIAGREYVITRTNAWNASGRTVTVTASGTDKLDNVAGGSLILHNREQGVRVRAENGAWYVVDRSPGAPADRVRYRNTAYTASAADDVILADAANAAFTVTLPAVASSNGVQLTVKRINTNANAVTVQANAAELIDGANTYSLSAAWKFVRLACDGTKWFITGQN